VQFLDGKLLFSASDLVNFLGCKHATYLDRRDLDDPVEMPERDAATVLIFEKGIEHEKRHLAALKARGLIVVEVLSEGFDRAARTALTREVMQAGAEMIYQAALIMPPWLGDADFLERVKQASNLGAWSYEAVDTKLPRRAKPEHVIQLTTYSKLIGNEQGRTPTEMHVELGNNRRVSLDARNPRLCGQCRQRTSRRDLSFPQSPDLISGDIGDQSQVIGCVPIPLAAALPPADTAMSAWFADRNPWRLVGECFQSPLRDRVVVNEVGDPQ